MAARQRVFHLFSQIADSLDPTSGLDIQLIEMSLTVTAAEGSLDDVQEKAAGAGARWREEDEEF